MGNQFELKPGIGIGDLTFGASREHVRRLLGTPSTEETFDSCERGDIRWFYPSLELNVYFGREYSLRMCTLETAHTNARLWKVPIIGLKVVELLQLFEEHNSAAPEIAEASGGEMLYHFDDSGCDVYVEEGVVKSIQMGVLFNDAGDDVLWPDNACDPLHPTRRNGHDRGGQ
jgi:hypothetical protein